MDEVIAVFRMVGAILAGGESRRFGSPKAFAKQNGVYFFNARLKRCVHLSKNYILSAIRRLWHAFNKKQAKK
ncbi:NTP transferase domain-containing protein [Anoxybacillus kestanbolensis]|uniref:NTP transferase domain-containing protein n=1 Tax=Anoxybacillus kestanbolensis TaxID=227476 RepID=UPI0032C2485E